MSTFCIYFSTIAIAIGTSWTSPQAERMGDEWTEETGEQSATGNSRYVFIWLNIFQTKLYRFTRSTNSRSSFNIFAKPVNPEDAPDYFDIIAQSMDLSTMMDKID